MDEAKQMRIIESSSSDQVRKLVKKEGIEAKNLVSWHVPLNKSLSVDISGDEVAEKNDPNSVHPVPDEQPAKAQTATPFSSVRMKAGAKRPDFRSRHWSYLFDNLRRTVDAIYDTCYFDQSVIECKEAIMILENCTKDFYALIEYLNNQTVWEKADKPTAVAWEVRKTAGSPNKHFPPSIIKDDGAGAAANSSGLLSIAESKTRGCGNAADPGSILESNVPTSGGTRKVPLASRGRRRPRAARPSAIACALAPVILPAKANGEKSEASQSMVEVSDCQQMDGLEQAKVKPEAKQPCDNTGTNSTDEPVTLNEQEAVSSAASKIHDDDGWEVVRYNRCRRNSMDRTFDQSSTTNGLVKSSQTPVTSLAGQQSPRSASTTPPKSLRGSVFPRSAQEIRQTKASLGKMVYNRQYLADQRQKELEDKMKYDGRYSMTARRRAFASSGASISLPSLDGRIGINFSNPEAVKRAAQALKASLMKGGGRTRRFRSYQSMESVQSLESIWEEDGGAVEKDVISKPGETGGTNSSEKERVTIAAEGDEKEEKKQSAEGETDPQYGNCQLQATTVPKKDDFTENKASDLNSEACGQGDEETVCSTSLNKLQVQFVDADTNSAAIMAEPDSDEALKHLTEEEESLAQEEESIQKEMEEERMSIDIEMKRQIDGMDDDDEEAEESENGDAKEAASQIQPSPTVDSKPMTWQELVARWEAGPFAHASLCWGDIVDMELADVRSPGQAAQVHEKLSSPSRQRNLAEAVKQREERRTKAYEMRQQILEQRHQRMRELSKRVDEVHEARRVLLERKKALMEERLAKAEENRNLLLMARVKKAHDEDEKVNEIAFINSLELGNKRLDVITRHHDVETRLLTIQEERQRRYEEKAAREAAAEERRKAADERRQTKVMERAERTRKRQQLIEQQRNEQERERQQLAKEKAREREGRLAELKAAKQANMEELLQRIQQKQEESTRRHEENLEQIKQRASEMSTPRAPSAHGYDLTGAVSESSRPPSCQPYTKKKLCTVCNVLIPSDVHLFAHLKGKLHAAALKETLPGKTVTKDTVEQESQKCIVEASDDKVLALSPSNASSSNRAKLNRKRRQRLRQKLQTKMKEYIAAVKKPQNPSCPASQHLQKIMKASRDIGKCLENCGLDKQWLSADIHALERAVGELVRILSQGGSNKEQEAFHDCKIQDQAILFLSVLEKQTCLDVIRLPMRSILNVCNMLQLSIGKNAVTALDMLYSNRVCSCINALAFQLQCLNEEETIKQTSSSNHSSIPQEAVVNALISLVTVQLEELLSALRNGVSTECFDGKEGLRSRLLLFLSYMVASGIVDQFGAYCAGIVELPMEGCRYEMVIRGFRLVAVMLKALQLRWWSFLVSDLVRSGGGSNGVALEDTRLAVACKKLLQYYGGIQSIADDATQLLEAIQFTDLCNILPILYSVLLSPNILSTGDRQTPPKLSEAMVNLIAAALDLINCTGAASWKLLQDIFGQEGSSLEFRHVASFLISYGNRYECQQLLHPVIISVGYFTLLNSENQDLVHFGNQPSILQQLCVLPFAYFSDERLTQILYPTLIACTYRNEANRYLLEQELSCTLLAEFLKRRILNENDSEGSIIVEEPLRYRFPKTDWNCAVQYFESSVSPADDNTVKE